MTFTAGEDERRSFHHLTKVIPRQDQKVVVYATARYSGAKTKGRNEGDCTKYVIIWEVLIIGSPYILRTIVVWGNGYMGVREGIVC